MVSTEYHVISRVYNKEAKRTLNHFFCIHVAGNDKLRFYGIWIHICIDGFVKIINIHVDQRQKCFDNEYNKISFKTHAVK